MANSQVDMIYEHKLKNEDKERTKNYDLYPQYGCHFCYKNFSTFAESGYFPGLKHSTLEQNDNKIQKLFVGLYKPLELDALLTFHRIQ